MSSRRIHVQQPPADDIDHPGDDLPQDGDLKRERDPSGRDDEQIDLSQDPDVNLQRGLIAHYTFDGHANDSSTNRSSGTVIGPELSYD